MGVRRFELFHGAVLTKLVRNNRPLTLRLIETEPSQAWATYTINDSVTILIKYCATPRNLQKNTRTVEWDFVFSDLQLQQLSDGKMYLALVCVDTNLKSEGMEVCLIDPGQVGQLVDRSSPKEQWLTVAACPRQRLRVRNSNVEELMVPRNRLDDWEVADS